MAIVSISLNDKILEDIDGIQKELGFSGRSEVIRCALRLLIEENRQKEKLSGRINVIMIAVHDKQVEDMVTEIKHKFEDIINTQIHSHIKEGKCLDIFLIAGDADDVKNLFDLFSASGKMDYVKLVVA